MKISFEGNVVEVTRQMESYLNALDGGTSRGSTSGWTEREALLDYAGADIPDGDATASLRRGTNTGESPTEVGTPTLSDGDITKAASEAAMKLTPAKVQEVIASHGVKYVGELNQDQRRRFIDQLEEEVSNV